jgi:hypothetical protein
LNKQLSKLGITLDPNHATPIMEISVNPADTVLPVAQLDSQSQ